MRFDLPSSERLCEKKAFDVPFSPFSTYFYFLVWYTKCQLSKKTMTYLKNIVITGASRGLGLEFVNQLCKTSSCQKIFASCRNPDNATELQKLADDHVQVVIKKLDVDNIDSFQPFVDEIEVFSSG